MVAFPRTAKVRPAVAPIPRTTDPSDIPRAGMVRTVVAPYPQAIVPSDTPRAGMVRPAVASFPQATDPSGIPLAGMVRPTVASFPQATDPSGIPRAAKVQTVSHPANSMLHFNHQLCPPASGPSVMKHYLRPSSYGRVYNRQKEDTIKLSFNYDLIRI